MPVGGAQGTLGTHPRRKEKVMDGSMEVRKEPSVRKIEANRKNAQHSTGPRTAVGKQAVKWNALKHGLLSREVVIPAGDGKESKVEYRILHTQLREHYQPVGIVEELLVEQIAAGYWRLRRLVRCETGAIRKRLDTVSWRIAAKRDLAVKSD